MCFRLHLPRSGLGLSGLGQCGLKDTVAFFSYHEAMPDTKTENGWSLEGIVLGLGAAANAEGAFVFINSSALCHSHCADDNSCGLLSESTKGAFDVDSQHDASKGKQNAAVSHSSFWLGEVRAHVCMRLTSAPVWGCFGGVSSGGLFAMPVTGSFTPGQTERQLQGPEFRNSLKENLVGLFVGRGTWKYALGL